MTMPIGLKPYFRAISWLGVLALIGDTALSALFGWTIGLIMVPVLAVISLASGLLLVAALFFDRIGWRPLAIGLAVAWVPIFLFNAWSNMGVATSNRMGEVQLAHAQQKTYAERGNAVKEAKRELALFEKQLATLIERNAWAATVTADGLRQQITALQAAEASESRLGGCGPKCRAIQDKIASVQGQIAVAEQRQDLTQRIASTKAILGKHRATLATTKAGISNTANQSALYAKLMSWNLAADPDRDMVTVANESTGIATAIILALISAALTLVGAWPHLVSCTPELLKSPPPARPAAPPGSNVAASIAATPPVPAVSPLLAEAGGGGLSPIHIHGSDLSIRDVMREIGRLSLNSRRAAAA